MERKDLLSSPGAGAAFALPFPCLRGSWSGGSSEMPEDTPNGMGFTIDLSGPDGADLADAGDFIIRNKVVVARNLKGNFVAGEGEIFECYVHGSRFSQHGTPLKLLPGTR